MVNVFEKMAISAELCQQDFEEFFAEAASLSPAEVGAILGFLLGRLSGHDAASMVSAVRKLHPPHRIRLTDGRMTVNLVGTGGGPTTFNITTTAAFVVAAAGAVVVKTGSNACRSKSGFADVAAKLGTLKLMMPWNMIKSIAASVGIVFVPVSSYAQALGIFEHKLTASGYRNVASFLNNIGPLLSPADVDYRFIGANSPAACEMLANACCRLGDLPTTLVSSEDGLDEVSSMAPTRVVRLTSEGDRIDQRIDPQRMGIPQPSIDELQGYEPAAAAECCERVLSGRGTLAQNHIVALNAGTVLAQMGLCTDLAAGFEASLRILADGQALQKLNQLRGQVWKWVRH